MAVLTIYRQVLLENNRVIILDGEFCINITSRPQDTMKSRVTSHKSRIIQAEKYTLLPGGEIF